MLFARNGQASPWGTQLESLMARWSMTPVPALARSLDGDSAMLGSCSEQEVLLLRAMPPPVQAKQRLHQLILDIGGKDEVEPCAAWANRKDSTNAEPPKMEMHSPRVGGDS